MEPLQRIRGSLDQWICYDLAGGVFVSVVEKRTLPFQPIFPSNEDYWNAWEERPSIQAQAISTETLVENDGPTESVATIQVIHLPNPHTDEGLKHQAFQLKSFLPQGIAIDPGQDLLVLLEIDMQPGFKYVYSDPCLGFSVDGVHIRRLLDNKAHHLCTQTPLACRSDASISQLSIAGDKIALAHITTLTIWDWKSGVVLSSLSFGGAPTIQSFFSFLTPNFFLVHPGDYQSHSIFLYAFGNWTNKKCRPIAQLLLPAVQSKVLKRWIIGSLSGPLQTSRPGRMFMSSQEDGIRLIMFYLSVQREEPPLSPGMDKSSHGGEKSKNNRPRKRHREHLGSWRR
ncbi:hypothetical protein SISSUDRAFT_1034550 [Sistotremastrum suecicum HHB10207 ss-3]|uniref:Uncharacterized protein n=1 Tax=Sistotremastrum suecicum HHB10207 ss-3 TaxID=1314776 RepID=A0A166BYW6_9AGAM|nr:hypothetical protein SISSUDRAFT_1034550 [Sistotremastrum suecicum HHB10207 ss-3]